MAGRFYWSSWLKVSGTWLLGWDDLGAGGLLLVPRFNLLDVFGEQNVLEQRLALKESCAALGGVADASCGAEGLQSRRAS
jgi:hypothetical protein